VNKAPDKPLSPLVKEFLAFVLSKDGQEIVIKDGYLPLRATCRRRVAEAQVK
jgi:phosphate transport system substrate-binding protein